MLEKTFCTVFQLKITAEKSKGGNWFFPPHFISRKFSMRQFSGKFPTIVVVENLPLFFHYNMQPSKPPMGVRWRNFPTTVTTVGNSLLFFHHYLYSFNFLSNFDKFIRHIKHERELPTELSVSNITHQLTTILQCKNMQCM